MPRRRFGWRVRRWFDKITAPPAPLFNKPLGRWEGAVVLEVGPSLKSNDELRSALLHAVSFWNERYPGLFIWTWGEEETEHNGGYPPRPGVVTCMIAQPEGGPNVLATSRLHYAAHSTVDGVKRILSAHIEMRPTAKGEDACLAFAHELGHVLGLPHISYPTKHLMGLAHPGWLQLAEELQHVARYAPTTVGDLLGGK